MREFLQSLWTERMRVGWLILSITVVVVLVLDALYVEEMLEQAFGPGLAPLMDGVIVELNGALADVALFGVVVLWFDERRELRQRKQDDDNAEARRKQDRQFAEERRRLDRELAEQRRLEDEERDRRRQIDEWNAQLSDFRGWNSEESAKRTAGIVRRLVQAGETIVAGNAWLKGGQFPKASFVGANLHRANLEAANLFEADLRGANLHRANLEYAEIRGANLESAKLGSAMLRGAKLWNANLTAARLGGAVLDEADLEHTKCQGAGFRRTSLQNALLAWADFTRARLPHANLAGADLRGTSFADAELGGASFIGARRRPEDPPIPGWVLGEDGRLRRDDAIPMKQPECDVAEE